MKNKNKIKIKWKKLSSMFFALTIQYIHWFSYRCYHTLLYKIVVKEKEACLVVHDSNK